MLASALSRKVAVVKLRLKIVLSQQQIFAVSLL